MKNEQPLTSLDEMDGGGGEGGREDARPQGQLQLGTTHFKISSSESNVVNCFGFLLGGSDGHQYSHEHGNDTHSRAGNRSNPRARHLS